MQYTKQQIIDYLVARGDAGKAAEAEADLPAVVDTDSDPELLARLDVQPEDLMGTHPPGPAGLGGQAGLGDADRLAGPGEGLES
ncbi:hypothetical protein [Arthrobacter dokdonensis]|uniref:hypothetical protein n=1 Tax=Arthrobacter dokdonellae TaxID=2211210 RepID=UPI000DE5B9B2|nr:hypothetical protein [Arthrobacter dokdonellae]